MDTELQKLVDSLAKKPQKVAEAIQLRLVNEIVRSNAEQRDIVSNLSTNITNLCPRLALRLAFWDIQNDEQEEAIAVLLKALRNLARANDQGLLTTEMVNQSKNLQLILEELEMEVYRKKGRETEDRESKWKNKIPFFEQRGKG
ncbi:hypothetical protein F5Y19DRAFT_489489 [Xylariaceae sp. FL1651]|nr:hypothetical protein F5Y19DRAFT_489489 [Xylariaceae sp. FL1651]